MNTTQRLAHAKNQRLSPIAFAQTRELILGEGIVDLVSKFDIHIRTPSIDSRGEILLESGTKEFGEKLAQLLNTITVRHGISPSQGHVEATGHWCYINHFDLETLLLSYDKTVEAEEQAKN